MYNRFLDIIQYHAINNPLCHGTDFTRSPKHSDTFRLFRVLSEKMMQESNALISFIKAINRLITIVSPKTYACLLVAADLPL